MPIVLVNPLDETSRPQGKPAPRIGSLEGKTVALLDISKPGGSWYLERLGELLEKRFGVRKIVRETKATFTKVAPEELIDRLVSEKCDAVIEALAD